MMIHNGQTGVRRTPLRPEMFALKLLLSRPTSYLAVIVFCIAAALPGGCSTVPRQAAEPETGNIPAGVVILGLVARSGLKAPVDLSRLSTDLAGLLAGRGVSDITTERRARELIGAGPHDEMLAFHARHGRLAPYQVQRLMAANLPATKALIVRLEADSTEDLPVEVQDVLDQTGRLDAGRERRIYKSRRTTVLSAVLMNLQNGRIVWKRQYRVSPETMVTANHQVGDSFGSSLAAVVANTMTQGREQRRHPAPPSLSETVLALLQEVAYKMPID